MEIQRAHRRSPLLELSGGKRRWALLFTAYSAVLLLLGAWTYRSGIVTDAVFGGWEVVENGLRRLGARISAEPLELRLDVKHENLLKIAAKRDEALRRNLLVAGPDDFVKADIRVGDESVPVEIRLKGDLRDHWEGDKWSLRVETRGDRTLLGMKQFSLQHPRTRDYLSEWIYHEALRREDLPALRYAFVRLVLNGKEMGIYALEEHFEKRLIENNRLREGPIVRFSEELSWAEAARQGFLRFREGKQLGGAGSYLAADVDAFQSSRWITDAASFDVHRRALTLLDGFRNGALRTSQAFDVPKLARFLAVSELMGSAHAAGWRNMRFYFNPVTTLLEPVGFDAGGHGLLPIPSLVCTIPRVYSSERSDYYYNYAWFDALFADQVFYAAYFQALERITTGEYVRALVSDLAPGIEENLEILHSEYPEVSFSDRVLWENAAYIRSVLEPERALTAHQVSRDGKGMLAAIGNLQFLPVEILGLDLDGELVAHPRGGSEIIAGRDPKNPVELVNVRFRFDPDFALPAKGDSPGPALRVRHRMLGGTPLRTEVLQPEGPLRLGIDAFEPLAANAEWFSFVVTDVDAHQVTFMPGSWVLTQDLVVPAGWELVCGEGVNLDLRGGAAIVSHGPISFEGSEAAPIVVRSSDGSGQGLVVLGAGGPSRLRHVRFEGLGALSRPGWELTSAVTFYESPVTIEHCVFRANTCEDALNTIRTRFDLSFCLFEDTFSDAFDADFCQGRVADCSFVRPGNDGVDVSGSSVDIVRLFVQGAGDKGISAGEASEVRASDVVVHDSVIGMASKDLSRLVVERANLWGCRFGVALYQKKPEFGPSSVEATGLALSNNGEDWLIETGSRAVVDGVEREGDREHVYDSLYGAEE